MCLLAGVLTRQIADVGGLQMADLLDAGILGVDLPAHCRLLGRRAVLRYARQSSLILLISYQRRNAPVVRRPN